MAIPDSNLPFSGFNPRVLGDSNTDTQGRYSPTLRVAKFAVLGYGLNQAHRYGLRNVKDYGTRFHHVVRQFELRSPNKMFSTFRFAEMSSAYLVDNVHYTRSQLVHGGALTPLGSTLERMSGNRLNILDQSKWEHGLSFERRAKDSAYLHLVGDSNFRVRMASGGEGELGFSRGSVMAGSAERLGADLSNAPFHRHPDEHFWKYLQRTQNPAPAKAKYLDAIRLDGENHKFSPLFGEYGTELKGFEGFKNKVKAFAGKANTVAFEMMERPQHLLAQMRIGLKQGSYNKIAHIPFVGEGGLLNGILLKRALPAYLGWQALKFADHKLHHAPSNALLDLPLRASVFHAELTDKVPGARATTDWYASKVPGSQYGPLTLPAGGMFIGGLIHYASVLKGIPRGELETLGSANKWARSLPKYIQNLPETAAVGLAIGLAAMLPFVPGMLGDRKTANQRRREYSGQDEVPIRQGRWWDMGATPWEGGRIKYFRQHASVLRKSQAENKSLYGDEKEYWAHHPLLHPFKYLSNPYWMEELHLKDRPYPVTSPWGADIPLIGSLVAATVGKWIKPVRYMHQDQWKAGDPYNLYGPKIEPRGPGPAAPKPTEEFSSPRNLLNHEASQFADWIGMPGFTMKSLYENYLPDQDKGRKTFLQGSRQMTSASRRYYDKELGAMLGPNPSMNEMEPFGYSEMLRRFIQPERHIKQVNPLQNEMPSWMPGPEGMINFHQGDPYIAIAEGFARLPGAGYAALHPELEGVKSEAYPLRDRFRILADTAPYSRQFAKVKDQMLKLGKRDTATRIEYERVMSQVNQVKESGTRVRERRFTEKTETVEGTVKSANQYGVEFNEHPGRRFSFSSVGLSAADLSAISLGQNNQQTESEVARDVDGRHQQLAAFLQDRLAPGTSVKATVRLGAVAHEKQPRAVFEADGENLNRELIKRGLGRERPELGGPESKAMYGGVGKLLGKYAEAVSFTGDESALNPLRYVPQPYNTKLWQNRTPISQYEQQEVYGTRMRRWHRPIHDFVEPYLRGIVRRVTGARILPEDVQRRRDLNTLSDTLSYLRGVTKGYTNEAGRTSTGANQFADPEAVVRTLSDHEGGYFRKFLHETSDSKRRQILEDVSPEMTRSLSSQWVRQDVGIAKAAGKCVPEVGEGGRLFKADDLEEYSKAKTQLDYGDYQRSKEAAGFFKRAGFKLPDADSQVFDEAIDYKDVKLKIIQNEGRDAHDFNIFDDRAALLWRKPYIDGTARELTSGDTRSVEQLRVAIEKMMVNGRDKRPKVRVASHPAHRDNTSITLTTDTDQSDAILKDMRRNPDDYPDKDQ